MHDKPHPAAHLVFPLPDQGVIELRGADSATFAQAQFMNDVNALGVGQWQWNGWLTAKGRVVTLFALLRIEEDRLWLLVPDADREAVASALRRFVFRSKLAIGIRDDMRVTGQFAAPAVASRNSFAGDAESAIELDFGAGGTPRCLRIGKPAGEDDEREDVASVNAWKLFDLEHGWPRLDPSQAEHWTPQQLSLERLNAFSVRKGCYPGQEIVARTHFLGKAKRGLVLVESDRPLAVGAQLHTADGDSPLGTLVACAGTAADQYLALAVVPLQRDAGALAVDGVAVREIALGEGLAR